MMFRMIGTLAAGLLLACGLAGCVDADLDVALTSATTAKASLTQTMGAQFYTMLKLDAEPEGDAAQARQDAFCRDGTLTENADGTATCAIVREGPFAALSLDGDGPKVQFTAAGPGLVRIALPTAALAAEVGADEAMDEETTRMIEAFFAGRAITVGFSGGEVVETNMTLSDDTLSASSRIMFLDLIRGTATLPPEFFAVVRVP